MKKKIFDVSFFAKAARKGQLAMKERLGEEAYRKVKLDAAKKSVKSRAKKSLSTTSTD